MITDKRLSVPSLLDSRHLSAIHLWLGIAVVLLAVLHPRDASADLKLLVGSLTGSSLSAYDGSTGASRGAFAADAPYHSGRSGLAIGGPSNNLFVATLYEPRIDEYDATTGAFIRTLVSSGVDAGLSGIAFGPDGHLYGRDSSGGISRWDAATGAPVGVFVAPGSGGLATARGFRFGPDGNLYVCNYDSSTWQGQVLRYDGTTGLFLDVFVGAGSGGLQGPTDLVFSPDGDLFVSGGDSDTVLRYDGTTGSFMGIFAYGGGLDVPFGLTFGPDRNLYVSSVPDRVLRFDGASGAFMDVFAGGTQYRPTFLLFSPSTHAPSEIIEVDTTADDLYTNGNCSLREAIRAANLDAPVDYCAAGSGFDFISVPAGVYHLTRAGANEDEGLTGDLDLRSGIALQGAGSDLTVIDADGLGDRVMHVMPPEEGPDIQVEIRDLTLRGGSAYAGGGIQIDQVWLGQNEPGFYPSTTIDGCAIEDNVAHIGGGLHALHSDGGETTVSKTSIRSNRATSGGAGIDSSAASLFLRDSTVEGNVLDDPYGDIPTPGAGGIVSGGMGSVMTIRRSTIARNRSVDLAGGINVVDEGRMSIGNSTISGNDGGRVGGIAVGTHSVLRPGHVMIEFTTISGNHGFFGGGILHYAGVSVFGIPSLLGTLVAGNYSGGGGDVEGDFVSRGDNLIGDGGASTGFSEPGDQVGTSANPIDPLLDPLADNGGLTETQALAPASPARDAADCLGMIDDQRRELRPMGGACDIGAFELPEPGQGLLLGAGIALLGLLGRLRGRDRR